MLFREDCLYRANVRTCATIGAHIRVNYINIAFSDCINRTFINARAASRAVVCNFVSHSRMYFKFYDFNFDANIRFCIQVQP